ncbi:MAG TPA: GHMP kinase [Thermoanaerobaculia bacterium]|nr:GHMP kinase [Thermoanaerobaculia bacterium]
MPINLRKPLETAAEKLSLPGVIAYNRIDGPGSSLDLREFQQALWSLPPTGTLSDPSAEWTQGLPRTIGITIDTGTRIHAIPMDDGLIGIRSIEYGTEVTAHVGEVVPVKEHWLLKILDLFNLSGVMFVLENLHAGTQSAGLGGSATATTGVCILANELAGRPFSNVQLISLSSRLEQDFGVSITGTQEQSNVIYGGVTDYVWYPWGIPGSSESGYGSSLRYELIPPSDYAELESRMAIFHSGHPRPSTDVNFVWRQMLMTAHGYRLHAQKPGLAFLFRESLRLRNWDKALEAIERYRQIRTELCPAYMEGCVEILGRAKAYGCTAFPLGAGGGGSVLVFSASPAALQQVREDLSPVYREIRFRIREKGHELHHLPLARHDR